MGTQKQGRIAVMAHILSLSVEGSGLSFLSYKCNLSFSQLLLYVDCLVDAGLLKPLRKRETKIYRTTAKGRRFLEDYQRIMERLQIYA